MGLLHRMFSSMHEGSLRGAVITFVRLCLGLGVFVVPYYASDYGLLMGLFVVLIAGLINYCTFIIIYQSSEVSKKETLPGIVDKILGKKMGTIFRYVILFEMIGVMIIYAITCWQLYQKFMYEFGYFKKEWAIDQRTMEFPQYKTEVLLYRLFFFIAIFVLSIKLLFKKSMENQRFVSTSYIVVMVAILGFLLFQTPFYVKENERNPNFHIEHYVKPLHSQMITSFFSILLLFNIHCNSMDIKNELFYPVYRRIKKVTDYSMFLITLGAALVAVAGYWSLGDDDM